MAEIFRPQFGKKPEAAEAHTQPIEKPEAQDSESLSDIDFVVQHSNLLFEAIDVETDFVDFLEKLGPGVVTDQNVNIRRQGLQQKTLQDLCTIWLTSRETDWQRNPSFYAAVVIERELRTAVVKEGLGT